PGPVVGGVRADCVFPGHGVAVGAHLEKQPLCRAEAEADRLAATGIGADHLAFGHRPRLARPDFLCPFGRSGQSARALGRSERPDRPLGDEPGPALGRASVGFAAARCQALPWAKRREISGAWQRGAAAIDAWSQREIFGPQVTLEVLDVTEGPDETVVST